MDRAFQPSRKYPRRPAKSGLVDGFAEENAIFGGYNQAAASTSGEPASGNLRLLDNFSLYVQIDDEGNEELVDLQDLSADGVNGLPLKATGTVLDHRLCSQQSVYDARTSSKIKVRIHHIRDWVVDYAPPVTVWLITDWAWYRLLSPSRIYKQLYQPAANKTKLVAACLQVVSGNPRLPFDSVVRKLAEGVSVLPPGADPDAPEYISGFDGHDNAEVQQFGQHDLLDHAAFVVQQIGPLLGRHALTSFLVTLADRAGVQLRSCIGTGRRLTPPSGQSPAADIRRRPAPQTSFLVANEAVPSLLLVWDFCQRYGALLRLPPFPFLRLQLACLDQPPPVQSNPSLPPSPVSNNGSTPERSPTSCRQCDATFSSTKALREHCSLSGHDPTPTPKSAKQKPRLAAVQPAVPLELSVQPVPDQVEMDRWGPTGQGRLLCDIHSALIRVLEGLDEDLMEAPTMAGYGSATDLAPQDAYRPLLGASWPELARRYLQDHGPLTVSQEAVDAVLRLKVTEYDQLAVLDRALILEALVTIVANTELLRNHLRLLEPEGATPVLNRGAIVGQDSAGNTYHQLGGPCARGCLYVEAPKGREWGWYSPQQIPSLTAWLETGSQQEQQLAEDLYAVYLPVLNIVKQPGQAADSDSPQLQELWQPPAPSHPLLVTPEALQQPRDGYKGSQPVIHPSKPLQHELLHLLATAPFWNKDLEWLQSRAAVQSLLPKATTGPEFARLLWLIEELLYEDLLKGSGWGRRRGWFREQLEATRNVAQAATLGGQLAAHCRREGDLGLVTPQELLQSAQRQRCYLGYIPQPPQDVVLFKSGYEAHIRQQDRSVPPLPAWLESWAPMQDCKVKQMACVVEQLPASQRQASLRSQNQPGFPPRVIEPPCTAWLLLEREPSPPQQGMSDEADEEIDWTHFTFQHGFRQLPQHMPHHLQQHFAAPPLSVVPSLDAEMSEASHSPSPSSFPPQAPITKQEPGLTSAVDHSPRPASLADQAEHHADSKQEAAQHAQHADLAPNGQGHAGHAELIEEQGEEALAGGMGVGADGEEGEQEGQEFDEESVEGQRLTRSRRGNAAGLYMLDHGSQLVPKKIRQARPVQRPARLLNSAPEEGSSMNLTEAERPPALLAAPPMLPGEDRVRFWKRERSLLAVALHVKPGMTRAAEFLVPVQLCNRALSVPWPAGMPVKMPFTGTVLDHLTKPRPDTRFCTGVLRQTLPAVRPAVMALTPGVTTTTVAVPPAVPATPAASVQAPAGSASAAAAAIPSGAVVGAGGGGAVQAAAATGASSGAASVMGADTVGTAPPGSSAAISPAAAASTAAQTGAAALNAVAATQKNEASMDAAQRFTPASNAGGHEGETGNVRLQQQQQQHAQDTAAPSTAGLQAASQVVNPASASSPAIRQDPDSATGTTAAAQVKSEPASSSVRDPAPASLPTSAAAASQAVKPEPSTAGAQGSSLQQESVTAPAGSGGPGNQAVSASATAGLAAPTSTAANPAANGVVAGDQRGLSTSGAVPGGGVGPGPGPAAAGGGGVGGALHAVDPWNALDVMWDSDTPPGWPKLVCPWQVMEDRGGELRKAKERYRQAEAEKREKARQEGLVREATRRAAAERQQQAAAALQAERMRRALEARAVVAQVAEQKEAGRAAMAAAQGGGTHGVTGPQLLASVVPRANVAGAVSGLGLPSASAASLAAAAMSAGISGVDQLQPHAQIASQQLAGSQPGSLQSLPPYTQAYPQPQVGSSGGTHAGQMRPLGGPQDNAVLQVQAALTGLSQANTNISVQPASGALQQVARPQHDASHGLGQSQGLGSAGGISSGGAGLQGVASAGGSGHQPPPGALIAAVGTANGEGALAGGTPGSSPAETENSGPGKRARSAEADEQSSPPRAKKQKPPAEGYRERWLAGKPRAQSKTWCSMLCCVCEQGGDESELLVCKGPCLRAFHPACLDMPAPATLTPATQAAWFCPECLHGRVRCFVCGEFGAGFEDPTVRKCSLGVCGRFYHIKCAQTLELTQMAKKGAHFRCPQHYCAVCQKSGDGVDMVKCIRCPTAYHSSCMPKDIQRLLPHAKVVLCSNHVNQPVGAYQHPPDPDPTKLEMAQQQGKAMGLPPVKAKCQLLQSCMTTAVGNTAVVPTAVKHAKQGHGSGTAIGLTSPEQRLPTSQQAGPPQESAFGQALDSSKLAAGYTTATPAGEGMPMGAITIQPNLYSSQIQGEQQASLEAGQSLSSSLPALQQLQVQPGLDSTAHPAANPMTAFAPHTASQQQQMVAGQQGAAATPFAGVPLQGVLGGHQLGGGPGSALGPAPGAGASQVGLNEAHVHQHTRQQLLHYAPLPLGFGSIQSMGSGALSHQSSEPLSHQSSAPLSHQGSGQLLVQMQQQVPAELLHSVSGQVSSQAQMGRHASGQLSQQSSGQLSQYPSGQLPKRQGSIPMGTDLITQGLRGSQIALELEAADRAKHQAASAAAAGMTGTAPPLTHGTGFTVPAPGAMPRTGLPNQAIITCLPQQTAALPNQAMSQRAPHQATASGMHPGQTLAAAQQQPPASHMGQMHGMQMYGAHAQQHLRNAQQQLHSAQGVQLPGASMLPAQQQQQQYTSNDSHMHAGNVNADAGGVDAHVNPLASPTIGLKLGQAHSPGLSEDALGGDQEFMDAMQAISDGTRLA